MLAALATGSGQAGQEQEPQARQEPVTVPIPDITVRLQEARQAVREIRNDLGADTLRRQAEPILAAAGQEIDRLTSPAYEIAPGTATADELVDRIEEWRLVESRLVTLEEDLGRRTGELNLQLNDLRARDELWQATLDKARAEELPEDVIERLAQLLDSVTGLRQGLRARRSEMLMLQTRSDDLLTACREDLNLALAAAEETRRQRLLLDSVPLWEAVWSGESDDNLVAQTAEALQRDWRALTDFVARDRGWLIAELLAFVALALLLGRFGRSAARLSARDSSLAPVALILERPASAALLLTALLGILVHPQVPSAYADLVRLLMVVTLVRILPRIVQPVFRPFVFSFAVIYVLDSLSVVAGRGTLLERLILLGVAVAAVVLAARLRRVLRAASEPGRREQFLALLYLAAAVFVAAALANLIGAVALAAWLQRSTLMSLYAGLLLRILFLTLDGLAWVGLRSGLAQHLRALQAHSDRVHARFRQVLMLGIGAAWVLLSLNYFGALGSLLAAAQSALGFSFEVGSLTISVGNVAALVLVIWLSFLLSAIIRFILNEQVLPGLDLPRGVRAATSQLTHYVILFIGFVLAIRAGGIDLTSFAVLAGAFGVGIGFGLQSVVNNFVSGIILLFERPVQVGDRIQVGEYFGDVTRIGIRASVVRTFDGAEVIVPNGNLLSSEVVNWTLSDQVRRASIPVGVAYGTDPDTVLQLLNRIAAENSKVLGYPEPESYFVAHGDSSLDFELRIWLRSDDYFRTRSDLTVAVNQALAEAGIEIPFPQRDLHVRSVAGEAAPVLDAGAVTSQPDAADESGGRS